MRYVLLSQRQPPAAECVIPERTNAVHSGAQPCKDLDLMSEEVKVTDAKDVVVLGNDNHDMEYARARSGFQTKGVLKDIDKDGDGFITREEVERFIGEHRVLTSEKKFFKYGLFFMIGLMFVFSFVVAGLTWGVIILSKETTLDGDVMVSSDSGDPVQCANTDLYVEDGVLLARNSNNGEGRRRRRLMTGTEEDDFLNDATSAALGVRNVLKKRMLSSTMPDKYFKELLWLEIESASGSFLSLRIMTVVRIPSANALCGTYLKMGTLHGTILLDEFDLYYDDAVNGVFLESGLIAYSTASSVSRRQLSSIDHGTMRRLSGNDFSLVGFFNAIDDAEWTCESVRKPRMPSEYSASFTVLDRCDVDENSPNQCEVNVPESPDPIPGYGMVTVDGEEYSPRTRRAYVTSEYSALVDTFAHFPDMTFVTKSFPDGVTLMYQFDGEGTLCQCYNFENMPIRMTLPQEYLLYPLGDVGDNLFRYRVSYMGIKGHISDGEEWIHIDYFEDNTTFMPKSLISDNNILQVDSMLTGDEMEHFSSSGFDISDDQFAWCSIATKVVQSDRYKAYINGESVITENSTLSEKKQYEDEQAAWDWISTPYPPVYASLASLGSSHLSYFAQIYTSLNETNDKYTGLNEFGEWVAAILNAEPQEFLVEDTQPENLNPNGTFYVPYSYWTGNDNSSLYQNYSLDNFTFNSDDMDYTWVNETLPDSDRLRALSLSDPSGGNRRQLGVSFSVDPFGPTIDISIEKYAIMYEVALMDKEWYHIIALEGEGCFMGFACVIGEIHATINHGAADKNDYGGSVAFVLDIKAMKFEVIQLRYDYFGGNKDYDIYVLSGGTHIAAAERTLTVLSQVRGTVGVELAMAEKQVKKSNPNWRRYNAGMVKLYMKGEYFKGIGAFGLGSWTTAFSYSYPVTSWGSSKDVVSKKCTQKSDVDLPINTWFPPGWTESVGDITAEMSEDGSFYIKIKDEVLWSLNAPAAAPGVNYGRIIHNENSNTVTFAIFGFDARWMFAPIKSFSVDISQSSQCKETNGIFCLLNGRIISSKQSMNTVTGGNKGKVRVKLYGNGNMVFEHTYVRSFNILPSIVRYGVLWRRSWESGIHGTCAIQAA
jgi:hypothetical protein